jgi:hypothetical protein
MKITEITEGYKQVWGRGSKGLVRKYRCTDGSKKGRVVAKPSTCLTFTNPKKSINLKKTRITKGKKQALKRSLKMKHPTSIRLKRLNKSLKPRHKRKTRR